MTATRKGSTSSTRKTRKTAASSSSRETSPAPAAPAAFDAKLYLDPDPGGVKTDAGGRPVTDAGGRPLNLDTPSAAAVEQKAKGRK